MFGCGDRFQKLRKKAGLTVTDVVELYYDLTVSADGSLPSSTPSDTSADTASSNHHLERILQQHAAYLEESLGVTLQALSRKPAGSLVIASESQSVGNEGLSSEFVAVIAAPKGSSVVANAQAGVQKMAL